MDKTTDEHDFRKDHLMKNIIGEIAVSSEPNKTIKKWRSLFRVSQKELSRALGVTSSVISDYESGRRKSPGIMFLRKYIETLIKMDEKRGGEVLRVFIDSEEERPVSAAILDIKEFEAGIDISGFCRNIGSKVITNASTEGKIYGYTLIDSVKAITELSFTELKKLYGVTTQRALVFTNITTGKGPMIAIKVANLKPALIVLHNINEGDVSSVAKNIADVEGVPLAVCSSANLEDFIERLREVDY